MAIHYVCNSCNKRIFPVSPRFHCLLCIDYDACQTCHLAARHIPPHEGSHLFHVVYDQTTSPPPTAALSSLTINQISQPPAPPPPPPPPVPFRSPPQPPPLPPRQLSSSSSSTTSSSHAIPQSPHSPHSPYVWGPLLTPQLTPTHHLRRLADAAFHHFYSPSGAPSPRTLTPEQLARFYTSMGRSGSTNFPDLFHTLMAQYGATLDPSDAQIAFVFQEYAYSFTLATRPGSSVPNGMPLLLLDGFRRMLTDEILEAPEEAWRGFNTLLAGVPGLGLGPGPIPRACFPEREDRAARARGDRISEVLVERSRAMLEGLERERERMQVGGGGGGGGELRQELADVKAEAEAREFLAATRARIEMEQRGMDACVGGWRRDEWGNEYYDQGLI